MPEIEITKTVEETFRIELDLDMIEGILSDWFILHLKDRGIEIRGLDPKLQWGAGQVPTASLEAIRKRTV